MNFTEPHTPCTTFYSTIVHNIALNRLKSSNLEKSTNRVYAVAISYSKGIRKC